MVLPADHGQRRSSAGCLSPAPSTPLLERRRRVRQALGAALDHTEPNFEHDSTHTFSGKPIVFLTWSGEMLH